MISEIDVPRARFTDFLAEVREDVRLGGVPVPGSA